MRVPLLEQPSVAPKMPETIIPQGGGSAGYASMEHGLDAAGRATDTLIAKYQQASHEAAVVDARDNLTAYERETTDSLHGASTPDGKQTPGFLATQGKAAAASSAQVLKDLDEKRRRRAESMTNETAKNIFLAKSAERYESARSTIESHVGQQIQVAKEESLNNAADEAIRAASVDPANDNLARQRIADVTGALHALGKDPEYNDKKALEVQGAVAQARLDALISTGDTKTAGRVLDENKYALGPHAARYQALITKANETAQAEGIASGLVSSAMRDDGSVNDRKALDGLDKVDPTLIDNVRPILYRRMGEAEQAYKGETERLSKKAFAAYNNGGWAGIPEGLKDQLNQRNPELYARLKNDAQAKWRRISDDSASSRRQQKYDNDLAMAKYMKMPLEERTAIDVKEKFVGSGANELGITDIEAQQTKDKTALQKGGAVHATKFESDALDDADGFLPVAGTSQKSKQIAKQARDEFQAKAGRAYVDFVLKNERPPTSAEAADLRATLISGKVPRTPEAAQRAGEAIARRAGGGDKAAKKVTIIGPNGRRAMADEAGLDAWLQSHPDWKRE